MTKFRAQAKKCRCHDIACPVHAGRFVCGEDAAFVLRSGDALFEPFCVPCAEDALFTGEYVIEEALDPTDIGEVKRELKDKDGEETYDSEGWPPAFPVVPEGATPPSSAPLVPLEPKEV